MKITGLDQLKQAAGRIRSTPDAITRAGYRSVNTVLRSVETQARRDIASQINLPQSYIREQTRSTKAGPSSSVGYVRMRVRAIRLARFGARQLTVAAPSAKGDVRRGIPAGRKQAGVSVKVARTGGRKNLRGAFLLPLRAGKSAGENGFGVFVRDGTRGGIASAFWAEGQGGNTGSGWGGGKLRQLYGPSPDQLFRRWRAEATPKIQQQLRQAFFSQLKYELRGSRK